MRIYPNDGIYVEVRVSNSITDCAISPILYDLTVNPPSN
jgi:hypothetical protein